MNTIGYKNRQQLISCFNAIDSFLDKFGANSAEYQEVDEVYWLDMASIYGSPALQDLMSGSDYHAEQDPKLDHIRYYKLVKRLALICSRLERHIDFSTLEGEVVGTLLKYLDAEDVYATLGAVKYPFHELSSHLRVFLLISLVYLLIGRSSTPTHPEILNVELVSRMRVCNIHCGICFNTYISWRDKTDSPRAVSFREFFTTGGSRR